MGNTAHTHTQTQSRKKTFRNIQLQYGENIDNDSTGVDSDLQNSLFETISLCLTTLLFHVKISDQMWWQSFLHFASLFRFRSLNEKFDTAE